MASASSSVPVAENPINHMDLPPIASVGKSLIWTGDVMKFNLSLLKFCFERTVDFESLKANDFDIEEPFVNQAWKRYFEMLNGPIYANMVKEFWMKSYVFDAVSARMEEEQLVLKDTSLKGKSREEMGLKVFNGT
ncbi:cullin-like protein, partial [Trifolium medium]|nr:cullin-like protein [Trifolium medium]